MKLSERIRQPMSWVNAWNDRYEWADDVDRVMEFVQLVHKDECTSLLAGDIEPERAECDCGYDEVDALKEGK